MIFLNYYDEVILILEIVKNNPNIDFQKLLDISKNYKKFSKYINSEKNNQELIIQILNTAKALINDGYIKGTIVKTSPFVLFNRITTDGYSYLEKCKDKTPKGKAKSISKKVLPNILFDIIKRLF